VTQSAPAQFVETTHRTGPQRNTMVVPPKDEAAHREWQSTATPVESAVIHEQAESRFTVAETNGVGDLTVSRLSALRLSPFWTRVLQLTADCWPLYTHRLCSGVHRPLSYAILRLKEPRLFRHDCGPFV